MKEIDEKILHYCGIYQQPQISEKKKKEILKKKRELEKLTGMTIEKVYVYGKSYWGKEANESTIGTEIAFLVDERIKRLDETYQLISDYVWKKKEASILFWSLCQFMKRKESPEEADYYVARYGALLYDSGKEVEIEENIGTTQYAATVRGFKEIRRYIHSDVDHVFMRDLLEIYLLKIGYYVELDVITFPELVEYVEYVTEDKQVKELLQRYQKEADEKKRMDLCKEFEKLLKEIKQVTISYKLEIEPTMKVYERKKEKKERGEILEFNKITKEELYIMYVIQKRNTFEIAELYGVSNEKITNKRKTWNIKLKEGITDAEMMGEFMQKMDGMSRTDIYLMHKTKTGMLSFERCIKDILAFMKTGEIYLLKEFWPFTNFEKLPLEKNFTNGENNTWYRATLALDFLKDNGLVEEVDFKRYRITKLGKELLNDADEIQQEEMDLLFFINELEEVDLFGKIYTQEDMVEIEEKENHPFWKEESFFLNEEKQETRKQTKEEVSIEEQIQNLQEVSYKKKEEKIKKERKVKQTKLIKHDYVKETEAKTEFGKKCEEIIYQKEKRRLMKEGRKDLAEQVEWTSQQAGGDGQGYDIVSYRKINEIYEKIYIEVKGTNKDYDEPFEISLLETEASEKYQDKYYLCRVAKASTKYPIYYEERGSISKNYELKPIKYQAIKK